MMHKRYRIITALLLLGSSSHSLAWWGGNGWDWNPWPVWTPMYWMEEMVGDNDWYDNYYGGPYGYGPGYGYGTPYGYGPGYGYGGYGVPYYGGNAVHYYGPAPYASPWRY